MTYNFDPDRWYENEHCAIETEYKSGRKTAQQFDAALDNLQRRCDDMLDRLDGTFQIPDGPQKK